MPTNPLEAYTAPQVNNESLVCSILIYLYQLVPGFVFDRPGLNFVILGLSSKPATPPPPNFLYVDLENSQCRRLLSLLMFMKLAVVTAIEACIEVNT